MRKTSPSWPSATRRRSSSSAGLKRSTWPTAPWTPAALDGVDELARLGAPSRPAASRPARATPARRELARRPARCSSVGTATIAKSSGPGGEQLGERAEDERRVARPRRSGRRRGRRRRRTSTRGEACSRRAWWRPIMPRPSTAPRSAGCRSWARTAPTRVPAMRRLRPVSSSARPPRSGADVALRRARRRPRRRGASATASSCRTARSSASRRRSAPRSSNAGAPRPPALVIEDGRGDLRAGDRLRRRPASGAGAIVGDQAYVRERARIGAGSGGRPGDARSTTTSSSATRVRLQSNVYMTAFSVVEDDVFVGPCAMTTNDDTMGRLRPGEPMRGATLRRACRDRRRRGARARASRWARRRSWPPARWSPTTSRRARSSWASRRARCAGCPTTTCSSGGPEPRAAPAGRLVGRPAGASGRVELAARAAP